MNEKQERNENIKVTFLLILLNLAIGLLWWVTTSGYFEYKNNEQDYYIEEKEITHMYVSGRTPVACFEYFVDGQRKEGSVTANVWDYTGNTIKIAFILHSLLNTIADKRV